MMFSWLPCDPFKEKTTVELKFVTSVSPYKLNNLETRISGFFENSILAAAKHLFERNSVGSLPQFGNSLYLDRNDKWANVKWSILNFFILKKNISKKVDFLKILKGCQFLLGGLTKIIFGMFLIF